MDKVAELKRDIAGILAKRAEQPSTTAEGDKPAQTDFIKGRNKGMFHRQIAHELRGHYAYLVMAAALKGRGLEGFANYFQKQAGEESEHARKIMDFMVEAGYELEFGPIPVPEAEGATVEALMEQYLDLERSITQDWYRIYQALEDSEDWAPIKLAQWFLNEQIQEEDQAVTLLQRVRMAGEGSGLLVLDQELAKRA